MPLYRIHKFVYYTEQSCWKMPQMPRCLCIHYGSFLYTVPSYFPMYALCIGASLVAHDNVKCSCQNGQNKNMFLSQENKINSHDLLSLRAGLHRLVQSGCWHSKCKLAIANNRTDMTMTMMTMMMTMMTMILREGVKKLGLNSGPTHPPRHV